MRGQPDEPSLLTSENVELLQQDAPWTRQSRISGHAQAEGPAQHATAADEPARDVRHDAALSGPPQTLEQRSSGLGQTSPQLAGPFGGPLGGRLPLLTVPASEGEQLLCVAGPWLCPDTMRQVSWPPGGEAYQEPELPETSKPSFAAPIPFDEAGRHAPPCLQKVCRVACVPSAKLQNSTIFVLQDGRQAVG